MREKKLKFSIGSRFGFSLIELLVVVGISLVLIGTAIAGFLNYNDKRSILRTSDELKSYFITLQNKAKVGDLGGCDELSGYRIQTVPDDTGVQVVTQAVCTTGTADAAEVFILPRGVAVVPNLNMTFGVINSGVSFAGGGASETIELANGGQVYTFNISREGRIDEGVWQ